MHGDHAIQKPTGIERITARVPGHPIHAGHLFEDQCVGHPIAPRPLEPEARHAHHQKLGANGLQPLPPQTEVVHHPR